MIAKYEQRAAKLAALAAFAKDPCTRRKYLQEEAECKRMVYILQSIHTKYGGENNENDS